MKLRTLGFNLCILFCFTSFLTSCSKSSKDKPVLLEQNDLVKITGKMSLHKDSKFLRAELYNGTEWTLTDVDVVVLRPVGKGDTLIPRRFRLNLCETAGQCFKPFVNGEFEENIGDFLDFNNTNEVFSSQGDYGVKMVQGEYGETTNDTFSWGIVSARGFKE
jgi:hypothetical protein